MQITLIIFIVVITFAIDTKGNKDEIPLILTDADLEKPASVLFPPKMLKPLPGSPVGIQSKPTEQDVRQIELDMDRTSYHNPEELAVLLKRLFGTWKGLYYAQVQRNEIQLPGYLCSQRDSIWSVQPY
jgi:hypothetical protein